MEKDDLKVYGPIGESRLLNIRVILDDEKNIYEGMIEEAPDEIKKLRYSKVEISDLVTYHVYSKFN